MDEYGTSRASNVASTMPKISIFESTGRKRMINTPDVNQLPQNVPTAKIVILGDASVGKTALRSQFVHHSFTSAYRATIGGDFLTYRVNTIGGPCNLQIWDTAGQERFNSISRSFYRGCDGCILVYDVTNAASFSNLSLWLNEFMANCFVDNPIIMVVGNKLDKDNAYRAISTRQARDFVKKNIEIREPSSLITPITTLKNKTSRIFITRIRDQSSPDCLTGQSAMSGDTTDFLTPRSAYTIQEFESEVDSDLELEPSLLSSSSMIDNDLDINLSSSLATITAKSGFSTNNTTPIKASTVRQIEIPFDKYSSPKANNSDFTKSSTPQDLKLDIIDQMEAAIDQLCIETSAKMNQNVDQLFEKMALFTLRQHETTVTGFDLDTYSSSQDTINLSARHKSDSNSRKGCC